MTVFETFLDATVPQIVFSNLDVGEQMEVVVSMVAGKKPGAFITIIGIATIQFTFKVPP